MHQPPPTYISAPQTYEIRTAHVLADDYVADTANLQTPNLQLTVGVVTWDGKIINAGLNTIKNSVVGAVKADGAAVTVHELEQSHRQLSSVISLSFALNTNPVRLRHLEGNLQ